MTEKLWHEPLDGNHAKCRHCGDLRHYINTWDMMGECPARLRAALDAAEELNRARERFDGRAADLLERHVDQLAKVESRLDTLEGGFARLSDATRRRVEMAEALGLDSSASWAACVAAAQGQRASEREGLPPGWSCDDWRVFEGGEVKAKCFAKCFATGWVWRDAGLTSSAPMTWGEVRERAWAEHDAKKGG